ncbi:MAG: hypothetical protein DRJ01_16025, partial [Bacteroidetes bacterium]
MKLFIKNLLLFLLFFGTISCHQPKIESPLKIRFYSKAYVSFDCTNQQIDYSGVNQNINKYLFSKSKTQQKIELAFLKLYHQYEMPYHKLYKKYDSIANIERRILNTTDIPIPDWYRLLALQKIEFNVAGDKLSSTSYRNFLNPNKIDIPSNKDLEFLNNLNLSSPYNQYINDYYWFLNFYSFYLVYGNNYVCSDSVT